MTPSRFGKAFMALVSALVIALSGHQAKAAFSPGADAFSSAVTIAETNAVGMAFNISGYSAEFGEPAIGSFTPYKSAWWKWTAPADGHLILEAYPLPGTLPSPIADHPLIAVYQGSGFGNLSLRGQATGSFVPGLPFFSLLPRVSIPVQAGEQLRIKMDVDDLTTVGLVGMSLRFFATGARTYQGAITLGYESGEQVGVTLSVTPTGMFTGKLTVPGRTYPFSGRVNSEFRVNLGMPNAPVDRPVTLSIDLANGTGPLPIAIFDSVNNEDGFLYPVAKFSPFPASISGTYTAVLDTGRSGYLTGKVTPAGRCTFAGTLGDGTKVSIAGALVEVGTGVYGLPFCRSLFNGKGFIAGGLRFSESSSDILDSTGFDNRYKRPPGVGKLFPPGIQSTFTITGGAYTRPPSGTRAMGFLNGSNGAGKLVVSTVSGEITGFTENLTLNTANKFSFSSPTRKPVLKVNPKTGIVSGSFEEPAGFKRRLTGILAGGPTPVLKGVASGTIYTTNFVVTGP